MKITIVSGPPCSGKTTFVEKYRQPGDLVWDPTAVRLALGGSGSRDEYPDAWNLIRTMRSELLQYVRRRGLQGRLWFISSDPEAKELQGLEACRVLLFAPRSVCLERAVEAKRSAESPQHIDSWFKRHAHLFNDRTRYQVLKVGQG